MTRKPNRSVAVVGTPAPAPEEPEAVGVVVVESVVELGLGETDGDDMVDPRIKMPPVENSEFCPGMDEWWLGPNTRNELGRAAPHSQIVFLIKKGGTSDYGVSSRDNHHTILARHHVMSAIPSRRN
jgi:hypothetical protein